MDVGLKFRLLLLLIKNGSDIYIYTRTLAQQRRAGEMAGHTITWINLTGIALSGESQTQRVHAICSSTLTKPTLWALVTEVRKRMIFVDSGGLTGKSQKRTIWEDEMFYTLTWVWATWVHIFAKTH